MQETTEKSAAKLATELFAILAFYLYFGGWVYASDILGAFGISLGNTDIPAYYFIVYSYSVFFTTCCGWLLLTAIGAAWYALARYRFVRWAEIVLISAVSALPFPAVRALASARAHADAAYLRGGRAKHVRFVPRNEQAQKYDAVVLSLLKSGSLRVLIQTKERYFAFAQQPGENRVLPAACVYDVPTRDFVAVINIPDTVEAR